MRLTIEVPDREDLRAEAASAGLDAAAYWQRVIAQLAAERASDVRRGLLDAGAANEPANGHGETGGDRAAATATPQKLRGYGMFADVPLTSDDFSRAKVLEKAREERFWQRETDA